MADAMDSKSIVRKGVWVRLPPPAIPDKCRLLPGLSGFFVFAGAGFRGDYAACKTRLSPSATKAARVSLCFRA